MKKTFMAVTALSLLAAAPAFAQTVTPTPGTPSVPSQKVAKGVQIPTFKHVWVIMMENHQYGEVVGNGNTQTPFQTSLAAAAGAGGTGTPANPVVSSALAYYGVSHPSLVNYLNMMGGSNFGVNNDLWPAWANGGCVDNAPGSTGCNNAVTPLAGTLTDLAEPATATVANGSCNSQLGISVSAPNNCALYNYPSESVVAETIADQLVAKGMTWKTYQQSLPTITSAGGIKINQVDGVNYADGSYSNLMPASFFLGTDNTGFANGDGNVNTPRSKGANLVIPKLYAVKHNPFVYFANIQAGTTAGLTESQVVDFDGPNGLFNDLAGDNAKAGDAVPNLSFIAPNQCYDDHRLSGTEDACNEDSQTQAMADAYLKKIVTSIEASKAWKGGKNAIVILYDENDYADAANLVPFWVIKNYGNSVASTVPYDHYSALRTLEAGFKLNCLNHACDSTSVVMGDVFNEK